MAADLAGKTVLVQGCSDTVGARVIATASHPRRRAIALGHGAHTALLAGDRLVGDALAIALLGVDHITEVAFGANIVADLDTLAHGASTVAYATDTAPPAIPFRELLFKNVSIHPLGSDDVAPAGKDAAAQAMHRALAAGWPGPRIAERLALDDIASAHERGESGGLDGRVILVS